MYHSAEVRWFFRNGPKTEVQRWFSSCCMTFEERPRIDHYIILPDCDEAGVKTRQGNIEVKARTQASNLVSYTDHVSGYQDSWVKWSRRASDPAAPFATATIPERWAHVEKSRLLRLLSLESDSPEEIAPGSKHLQAGCQAEKTEIRVLITDSETAPSELEWADAERWWSVSLEAFGRPADVSDLLGKAASHWFGKDFPAHLAAEDSMSYPEWLARLETRTAA